MQKANSADNGQEIVSEIEKGWLAGIIDGEGCLHIDLDPRGGAHPYLTITNTNNLIAETAYNIWQRLGVGCRVQIRKGTGFLIKDVQVIGFKRIKTALIAIMPYLVGKADEALLLYRFVDSRLQVDTQLLPNEKRGMTPTEMAIIYELKEQKHRNKIPRDYTPSRLMTKDIVRTTQRCVEVVRNEQPLLI